MSKFFEFGNHTDVGRVRTANEDYFGSFETKYGQLFVVCDGMGGHKGGYMASRLAVDTIKNYVLDPVESDPMDLLRNAIQTANQAVLAEASNNPELRGMGTTCVMLLIRDGKNPMGWRAHIGDSRLYVIRNNRIYQLTRDHSRVMEMVEHGIITAEDAEHHPDKNIITRAIGVSNVARPEVDLVELYQNDRFVLCTDGVSGPVSAKEILNYSAKLSPQMLAEMLVGKANERGGEDNATVQVIDLLTGPKAPKPPPETKTKKSDTKEIQVKKPWYKNPIKLAGAVGALIILLAGIWFVKDLVFNQITLLKATEKQNVAKDNQDTTKNEASQATDNIKGKEMNQAKDSKPNETTKTTPSATKEKPKSNDKKGSVKVEVNKGAGINNTPTQTEELSEKTAEPPKPDTTEAKKK